MPMSSSDQIVLTDARRQELTRLVRAGTTEQRLAQRAEIVFAGRAGSADRADRSLAGGV